MSENHFLYKKQKCGISCIKNWFSDMNKFKFLNIYQEKEVIGKYFWFFDIANSIFWYQKFEFLISENPVYFLMRRRLYFWGIFWHQKMIFDKKYANCLLQRMILWYQKFEFLISNNKGYFLISKNQFSDIRKSFLIYKIYKIWIFDIKKYIRFSNIKKYIRFSNIKNFDFIYQKFIFLI